MTTTSFTTTILFDQTPSEVFNAITNVKGWWQGKIEGSSTKQDDEFTYQMKEFHFSKQRVIEFVPEKKLMWLVTESSLSFLSDKTEWTGTKILFEITTINGQTELHFTHEGLEPAIECYAACSNGWSKLLHQSLVSLVTTAKGVDVF